MLRCAGHDLFFHEFRYTPETSAKEKKYEIDFLLVRGHKVCPVEVKSSNYRGHKSFDYFLRKYPIKVQERYIIYTKDLRFEDGITYPALYGDVSLIFHKSAELALISYLRTRIQIPSAPSSAGSLRTPRRASSRKMRKNATDRATKKRKIES